MHIPDCDGENGGRLMETIKIKYFADVPHIYKSKIGDWIDLCAAKDVFIPTGEKCLIPLGVAMQLPEGYEALVVPRSSTFKHWGIISTNHVGVIDESYCGDGDQWHFPAFCLVGMKMINGRSGTLIRKGDRICQFRIIKHQPEIEFLEVEKLGNPDRGGIGSTGKC